MPSPDDGQPPVQYRLFFAVRPSPLVARQTDHFAATLAPDARRIPIDHQHVTLALAQDQADYPYALVKSLLRAATAIRAEPFDLPLDRLSCGTRSVALAPSRSIAPLRALQHAIVAAMTRAGVALRPDWRFSPHQTLFHAKSAPAQRPIRGFCWRVEEFALICSHVGQGRHVTLGQWPLRGSGQYELF